MDAKLCGFERFPEVDVEMVKAAEFARIQIKDNGVGFDTSIRRTEAHGLMGMRHRIESLGGILKVDSTLGRGTTVLALIPLPSEATGDKQEVQSSVANSAAATRNNIF